MKLSFIDNEHFFAYFEVRPTGLWLVFGTSPSKKNFFEAIVSKEKSIILRDFLSSLDLS